jgi:hypothetical protein
MRIELMVSGSHIQRKANHRLKTLTVHTIYPGICTLDRFVAISATSSHTERRHHDRHIHPFFANLFRFLGGVGGEQ